jgi:bla regulator protein blaR1
MIAVLMGFGSAIANHLWQSTLFAVAAALLTLSFRKNHARVRYALWLSASLKFLIPFALLISIGSSIDFGWRRTVSNAPPAVSMVENISQPFKSATLNRGLQQAAPASAPVLPALPIFLFSAWLCGFAAVLFAYMSKAGRARGAILGAVPLTGGGEFDALQKLLINNELRVRVRLAKSNSSMEPGVFGIFRPVLLLPAGMINRLTNAEFEAILAHEIEHIRSHDNLMAAVQMLVEALFWFHPLVWWLGSRLIQEREHACDEAVLQLGKDPQSYAEGILKVCEFCLESPLACVAGITGSDMKKRIRTIMTQHVGGRLSRAKKLLLAGAGIAALAVPLLIGLLNATQIKAQSQPRPSFDAASIKPYEFDGRVSINTQPGRLVASGVTMKFLISMAYDIKSYQISGAPNWMESATYGIEAKAPGQMTRETMLLMLQSLIEERCKLKFHRETREGPVYSLVVAKGGHKLERSKDENGNPLTEVPRDGGKGRIIGPGDRAPAGTVFYSGNGFSAGAISIVNLASFLSDPLGRKIIDKTGISGLYDIHIQWAPDPGQSDLTGIPKPPGSQPPPADNTAPSIFSAVQEQLGLKLEPDKGSIDFFIIDSIEKPTEN